MISIAEDYYLLPYFFFALTAYFGIKYYKLKNEFAEQKKYFINTLGHDFRVSVIAQIRGLDLIQKSQLFKGESSNLINEINESCKYTLDMITTLIKIYKMENNELSLNYTDINLEDLVFNIFDELYLFASEKNINLNCQILNNSIFADKEHISKVIKSLIDVAVRYSMRDSVIRVCNYSEFDRNILRVYYKGSSLSFEEQNRMLSNNPNFSTVGYGMKMNLCKKIVDLHQGKFAFKSDTNGNNYFEVSIPK